MLIEVKNLIKDFTTKRWEKIRALEDVSFSIEEGEFVTVIGPSGCGKSTLLRLIAGLIPKTAGEIMLQGSPVNGPRKDIGIVFQSPVLLQWRTVLDNVLLPIHVLKLNTKDYEKRAYEILELVGLKEFAKSYPFELSGGMQQRVAISRALIHDPAILLMDEPFGALDAMTRETMNLELLRIWSESNKTVFFITHSIPESVFLAKKVIVLSARPGKIINVFNVELGYPRTLDMISTEAYGNYVKKLRSYFSSAAID
jgi:NitT/TauT family transport system ATP-binding protein